MTDSEETQRDEGGSPVTDENRVNSGAVQAAANVAPLPERQENSAGMSKDSAIPVSELQPQLQPSAETGAPFSDLGGGAGAIRAPQSAGAAVQAGAGVAIEAPADVEQGAASGAPESGPAEPIPDACPSEPARCKCGAEQHAANPERCANGHLWLGHFVTTKHGLYSQREGDEFKAPADGDWAPSWNVYRAALHRAITRLTQVIDERPGRIRSARYVEQLLRLIQQAKQIDREMTTDTIAAESVERIEQLATAMGRVVTTHVKDPATLRAIVAELRTIAKEAGADVTIPAPHESEATRYLTNDDLEREIRVRESRLGVVRRGEIVDVVLGDPDLRAAVEAALSGASRALGV